MKTLFRYNLPRGVFTTFDDRPADAIYTKQTHSNIVVKYQGQALHETEADGVVVDLEEFPNAIVSVKTADCLPVCILGPKHVALIHAGWRGVASKIVLHPLIAAMGPTFAFIGPSIHKQNFIVTKEFYAHFPGSPNFQRESDGTISFDLQNEVTQQLLKNFPGIRVVDSGICTFADKNFYSYRRDKGPSRNFNTFKL